MKFSEAINQLGSLESKGVTMFTKNDLGVVFKERGDTLASTVKRLAKYGTLKKVSNGVYANAMAKQSEYMLYKAASFLRPTSINYLSNESVLSNMSIISQQMLDRITVMTTGRSGTFKTPFGVVEFTHTKRNPLSILKQTSKAPGIPIRLANKIVAVRDLKRIGRNVNMIDWNEYNESE